MKGIKKIFISIVMFLAISMMSFFTIPSTKVNAACDHSNVFDPSNITYGIYYLDDVWTLTDNVTIDCTVFLCLNGHYIDMNGHTITINNGGCLKLSSCNNVERYFEITDKGLYVLSDENEYDTYETGSYVYNSTATYGFNVLSGGNLYVENIAFVGCTGTIIKADTACIDIENSRFIGNTGALIESNDSEVTIYGSIIDYNNLAETSNNLITEESGYLVINDTSIYYNTLNENYYAVSSSACKIIALTVINQNYGGSIKRNLYFTDDLDIDSSFMGEIYLNCDSKFTLDENTYKGAIKSDLDNFVCYKDSNKITHYEKAVSVTEEPTKTNEYTFIVSESSYNDYAEADDQITITSYQWYDATNNTAISGQSTNKLQKLDEAYNRIYCLATYQANGVTQTIKSAELTSVMSLEIVIPGKESIYYTGCSGDVVTLPVITDDIFTSFDTNTTTIDGFSLQYGSGTRDYSFGSNIAIGQTVLGNVIYKLYLNAKHTDSKLGDITKVFTSNDNALSNDVYFLIDDVKLSSDVTISGNVSICFNGYSIDMNGYSITIEEDSVVDLRNCVGTRVKRFNIDNNGLYCITNDLTYDVMQTGALIYNSSATNGINVSSGATLKVNNISLLEIQILWLML